MDRATIEMSATEAAEEGARQERVERLGTGRSILMVFNDSGDLEPVPYGKIADRCFEFISAHKDEPSQILLWQKRNAAAMREFWAQDANAALAVKKEIEKATLA